MKIFRWRLRKRKLFITEAHKDTDRWSLVTHFFSFLKYDKLWRKGRWRTNQNRGWKGGRRRHVHFSLFIESITTSLYLSICSSSPSSSLLLILFIIRIVHKHFFTRIIIFFYLHSKLRISSNQLWKCLNNVSVSLVTFIHSSHSFSFAKHADLTYQHFKLKDLLFPQKKNSSSSKRLCFHLVCFLKPNKREKKYFFPFKKLWEFC